PESAGPAGIRCPRRATRNGIWGLWVERRAVKVILTKKAESQFIRNGFADAARARPQELLNAHGICDRRRMRIAPRGIAATGLPACYIDYIFNSKAQSIEHAAASRRQLKRG